MTNSTDNKKPDKKKKVKKQGPIRFEAVLPVTVVLGLLVAYFFLFFDSHLRKGLEYGGTLANGAEVNIGSLSTSFRNATFTLRKLQVTNSEKPEINLIEIGQIHFALSWDALLRAKFLIEEASIRNLQIQTPRKRPGRVLPVEPASGDSVLDKTASKALKMAGKEFKSNVLGDLAGLLGGDDPAKKIKNLEGELKASLRAKELEKEFKAKEKAWQKRLQALPQAKDFEALNQRLKKVKTSGWKSPQEFQASLNKIKALIKEADQKVKSVQKTAGDLNGEISSFEKSLKSLDQLAKQDIKDLAKRFKIPSLDMKDMSKSLFGNMVQEKVRAYSKYIDMGRKYMPSKKSSTESKPEFTPHERKNGKNYKFGRPKAYPLFWLKKAILTSKAANSPFGGEIAGTILDVTNDQATLGRPTRIELKGDFPGMQIHKLVVDIVLDHRKEESWDWFKASVGSFPVEGRTLSQSPDVKLAFASAKGQTAINGELRGGKITILSNTKFHAIDYQVEAKNRDVKDILLGVVKDVPVVTLMANVKGTLTDLKWDIQSNLAGALQKGFEKQIKAKIQAARKKLEAYVNNEINKHKGRLQAQFNKFKAQVDQKVAQAKQQAEGAKNKAQSRVGQTQNKAKNQAQAKIDRERKKLEAQKKQREAEERKKLEAEGKKALDKLKNKFKF